MEFHQVNIGIYKLACIMYDYAFKLKSKLNNIEYMQKSKFNKLHTY